MNEQNIMAPSLPDQRDILDQLELNDTQREQIVLPSDAEIINGIFDHYTKEIVEAEKRVTTALDALRKNLMEAERNNIAIIAQKALVTAMTTDYKNAKASSGISKV